MHVTRAPDNVKMSPQLAKNAPVCRYTAYLNVYLNPWDGTWQAMASGFMDGVHTETSLATDRPDTLCLCCVVVPLLHLTLNSLF